MVIWITHSRLVDSVYSYLQTFFIFTMNSNGKGGIPSDKKMLFILKLFTIEIKNPWVILEFDQTQWFSFLCAEATKPASKMLSIVNSGETTHIGELLKTGACRNYRDVAPINSQWLQLPAQTTPANTSALVGRDSQIPPLVKQLQAVVSF